MNQEPKNDQLPFEELQNEQFDLTYTENRITDELIERNLIEKQKKGNLMKPLISIAAAIVLMLSSYYVGTIQQTDQVVDDRNMYAIYLFENDEFNVKDGNTLIEEYTNWAIDLSKSGHLISAEKLNDDELVWFGKESIKNETSKMTGYFMFYANSIEEAKSIASTHPHTSYGGGIELRMIDKLN